MPLFKPSNDDPDETPAEDSIHPVEDSFETARAELRRRSVELSSEANRPVEAELNPLSAADPPRRQEGNMEQVQWEDQSSQEAGARTGLHPFLRGLLETVPPPGAEWPLADREQWLETARNIFALIHQDPGDERNKAAAAPTPSRPVEPQQRAQ